MTEQPSLNEEVRFRIPFVPFVLVWGTLLTLCWVHRAKPLSGHPISGYWGVLIGLLAVGLRIFSWKEGNWIIVRSTRRRVRQVATFTGFFLLVLVMLLLWVILRRR